HHVRPLLRNSARRRGARHRVRLQHPRRGAVRGDGDRQPRRSSDPGRGHVHGLLRRVVRRRVRCAVRHARPPHQAERLMAERLLEVEDLKVSFVTEDGLVSAVDGVSFTLDRGEVVAIVGESGSGKSVSVMTLMGLTRSPNARFSGAARLGDRDLVTASEKELERIRGKDIAMIFQDPISSLSPVHRIGDQIVEQIRAHEKVSKAAALDRTVELMERVGIPRARDRARAYPHEFSGGMRQRAMIAMALSLSPSVLIADEPTTALDVTIQAQILDEVKDLKEHSDSGIIFVTHDLGVVADIADRVIVMYAGRVVEKGTLDEIFYDPQHPYTWGLLGSVTRMDRDPPKRVTEP